MPQSMADLSTESALSCGLWTFREAEQNWSGGQGQTLSHSPTNQTGYSGGQGPDAVGTSISLAKEEVVRLHAVRATSCQTKCGCSSPQNIRKIHFHINGNNQTQDPTCKSSDLAGKGRAKNRKIFLDPFLRIPQKSRQTFYLFFLFLLLPLSLSLFSLFGFQTIF